MYYLNQANEIKLLIDEFKELKTLWIDTEIANYQTNKPQLSLIQILAYPQDLSGSRTCILDVFQQQDIVQYFIKTIMENPEIEKVFHNAKYDLQFLGKTAAKNVTCTLEIAKKIPYYLLPVSRYDLKTLTEKLTDFNNINKQEQISDWGIRPLTIEQLEYAKMDPVYLAQIYHHLMELNSKSNPQPIADDLTLIDQRYQEIEPQWKLINSEINHLKERAKKAMKVQNKSEIKSFKLSNINKHSIKVDLAELVKVVVDRGLEIHLPITLTKNMQQQLGEILQQLPLEEEKSIIWQLKTKTKEK